MNSLLAQFHFCSSEGRVQVSSADHLLDRLHCRGHTCSLPSYVLMSARRCRRRSLSGRTVVSLSLMSVHALMCALMSVFPCHPKVVEQTVKLAAPSQLQAKLTKP